MSDNYITIYLSRFEVPGKIYRAYLHCWGIKLKYFLNVLMYDVLNRNELLHQNCQAFQTQQQQQQQQHQCHHSCQSIRQGLTNWNVRFGTKQNNVEYTEIGCRPRSLNPDIKPLPKILKHPPVSLVRPPLRRLYHRPKLWRNESPYDRLSLLHRTHRQPEGKLSHSIFTVPVQIWVQFFIKV